MASDAGPLSSEAVDPSPEVEESTLSNSTNLKLVCVCVRVQMDACVCGCESCPSYLYEFALIMIEIV